MIILHRTTKTACKANNRVAQGIALGIGCESKCALKGQKPYRPHSPSGGDTSRPYILSGDSGFCPCRASSSYAFSTQGVALGCGQIAPAGRRSPEVPPTQGVALGCGQIAPAGRYWYLCG